VGGVGFDWAALLTDYGRRDGFVAACHGVIARLAPTVRVIDITHDIPPQDVRYGAAVLAQTVRYLPPAVIVAVVDPGVGTSRRGVAIAAGESVLVGPDNGLLGWAAAELGGASEAVSLTSAEYQSPARAPTFDGRDVFAPVAAHVCLGTPLPALGSPADDLVMLPVPVVRVAHGGLDTEVLTVDHFGNVQLAARAADLAAAGIAAGVTIVRVGEPVRRAVEVPVGTTFADVGSGEPVLYIDAAGYAAIAVNRGSAAVELGTRPGDPVRIEPAGSA
jgi:S-adenosyl-L-methionine hydrolase (adenosine-forming)